MNSINKYLLLIIVTVLYSCVDTYTLKNGYQKAPTKSKVFKNKIYFNKTILAQIDTSVIYEQLDTDYYEGLEKQPDILARLNYNDPNTFYGVYRFHSNGQFSLFSLDRNAPELTKEMFDPSYTGWRGVLYNKKNKILGDIFTQVGQMSWQLGKQTYNFSFNGDTLIVELKNKFKEVYVKRRIDPNLLGHYPDW